MQPRRVFTAAAAALAVLATLVAMPAAAEEAARAPSVATVVIPRFSDARARIEKPNLPTGLVLKWATGDDYPPFHYTDADGQPVGFAVDLARAICTELQIACTLQAWRWDALMDTIDKGQANAILAMVRPTEDLRTRFAFSERVHQTPARFVARTDRVIAEVSPSGLKGRSVAVVKGSAHEAFLETFFPGVDRRAFEKPEEARAAVKDGAVDAAFGDAVSLAFWLNGTASDGCCGFVGGAYVESRYFGEGVGALVRPRDDQLRLAIDYALQRLDNDGTYAEIYLRHFPVGLW
jgi:polar amino acid transport system substrate-binding protein